MVNEKIIEEVKDELSRGMDLVELKQQLLSKGWSDFDIEEAVNKAEEREKQKKKEENPKESKKHSEDKKKKKGFFQKIGNIFKSNKK